MGENKHIEELDAFAKKYIKEITPEKVSSNFTSNLMKEIRNIEVSKTTIKSAPLISKKVWAILTLLFASLFIIPFQSSQEKQFNLSEIDWSFLHKFQLSNFIGELSISTTVFYAIILFGVMIFIQIMYLKKHFEQKLA